MFKKPCYHFYQEVYQDRKPIMYLKRRDARASRLLYRRYYLLPPSYVAASFTPVEGLTFVRFRPVKAEKSLGVAECLLA